MFNADSQLIEKWSPVLDHESAPSIDDRYRKAVTARLLENQEIALKEETAQAQGNYISEAAAANNIGSGSAPNNIGTFDPVLISLVRRAMPNLIAYDIAGVQPMTGPTGLIFAMKSKYSSQSGSEALYDEADTDFSGTGTHAGANPVDGTYTTGTGMATADAENLGGSGGGTFNEMAFSIEKTSVTAKSRALKAEYTIELAQDLKSVHGLDAEGELSNILSTEILSEINREVIRTVYKTAKAGAQTGTATAGTFDLDVDASGRWSVEKFKGLLFQIEREANAVAQQTRRGKANFIICSSDVASALAMAGVLDYAPALSTNLNVDEASTTFAGVLNGRYKVYVDPYTANGAASQYFVVGYKGASAFDAGLFYCPYVPLQLVRAVDPSTFQPKIGFKTRYGFTSNPFIQLDGSGDLVADENYYYRRVKVTNLM